MGLYVVSYVYVLTLKLRLSVCVGSDFAFISRLYAFAFSNQALF